ncbi:hypothetical protein L1286_14930 [Pseudoalteromonas sp. SMS1]|uniref:hypothetical protein n=1 Tax=Pseudoalteromonas sp. SMS1 TaxID=2908894 RepID=UPI001F2006BE|nr:hypothetical protein [Pseudoalteromonas sp. SMS1]MCF2858778.1 hypothetical protein [Pseudoalteromonas sp. SMS1]
MKELSKHLSNKQISAPENHMFVVTDKKQREHTLKLVPLNPSVAEIDYATVMQNIDNLSGIFGKNHPWPDPQMTYQQNLKSLQVHHVEFETQKAFAYSITSIDSKKCFGSVYIDPSKEGNYDCEVFYWVCKTLHIERKQIFDLLSTWLSDTWKFDRYRIH